MLPPPAEWAQRSGAGTFRCGVSRRWPAWEPGEGGHEGKRRWNPQGQLSDVSVAWLGEGEGVGCGVPPPPPPTPIPTPTPTLAQMLRKPQVQSLPETKSPALAGETSLSSLLTHREKHRGSRLGGGTGREGGGGGAGEEERRDFWLPGCGSSQPRALGAVLSCLPESAGREAPG